MESQWSSVCTCRRPKGPLLLCTLAGRCLPSHLVTFPANSQVVWAVPCIVLEPFRVLGCINGKKRESQDTACEYEYGGRFLIRDEQKQALHADTQRTCCLCVPGPAGPVPGLPVAEPGEAGEEGAVCAWFLWSSRELASTRGTKNQDVPLEDGCSVSCSASQGHLCPSWLVPRPTKSYGELCCYGK